MRTYDPTLDADEKAEVASLVETMDGTRGPFGTVPRFFFLAEGTTGRKRVGTYGFVKDAPAYIYGTAKAQRASMLDFGYVFERLILELTAREYGTVWLAGTFRRSQFDDSVADDAVVPAITPVGRPASRTSFRDRTIRRLARADSRKPISSLLLDGSEHTRDDVDPIRARALEILRIAPSAKNRQPWRVLLEQGKVSLYVKRRDPSKTPRIDMTLLDAGIALLHLETGLLACGAEPTIDTGVAEPKREGLEFIASLHYEGLEG